MFARKLTTGRFAESGAEDGEIICRIHVACNVVSRCLLYAEQCYVLPQRPREKSAMELDDANEMVIREALRRLGPDAQLDPAILQEQIAEVVKEQGETIFAQLNEAARQQLRRDGLRTSELIARLGRINEAIEYGRSLIAEYNVETLGELPQEEQLEFARLWANATGGAKVQEN